MRGIINILTLIILLLAVLTIYLTSYNIKKEFFSGNTKTIIKSEPFGSIEFPLVLNIIVDDLLEFDSTHGGAFHYFLGMFRKDITHPKLFMGWSNLDNSTSPAGKI